MGLIGAAFGLGFVFGPVIGGYFGGGDINNINYKLPFLIAITISIISCFLTFILLKEPIKRNNQFISINFLNSFKDLINFFKIPAILFLIIISFLVTFSFAGFETTFALWTERAMNWASKQTGYAFTFTALLAAIIQGVFIGKLTKIFGEIKLLISSIFLMFVGLFFITLSIQNLSYLIFSLAILGISIGLGNPTINSLLSKNLNKNIVGLSFGAVQSVSSLARILSPLIAGNLFYFLGINAPYILGSFLMFIALILFFYYFIFLKKKIKI